MPLLARSDSVADLDDERECLTGHREVTLSLGVNLKWANRVAWFGHFSIDVARDVVGGPIRGLRSDIGADSAR